MAIDQTRDPTLSHLYHLLKDRPQVEEMVKEAEISEESFRSLPDSAFAWPSERLYPVHSREQTILSRIYREKAASVPAFVDEALKEACEAYKIPEEMFTITKVAAEEENREHYLLPQIKKILCKTAEDVRSAERVLLEQYQKLSVEHRAEACGRLMEKAASFGVKLSPPIAQLAGFTVSSTSTLRDWLYARKEAAVKEEYKTAYQKLADALRAFPGSIEDRGQLVQLADTIHELDKKAGLEKFYDRKLPDPIKTVFNTQQKIASAGVDLNGRFVPLHKLAMYDATFYGDVLGDDLVREASDASGQLDLQKLATIIETLPRDLKTVLARNMRV